MNLSKTIKGLCTPAYVYFIIASISILFYFIHMTNNGISDNFTSGGLVLNVAYTLVWTWFLNLICNSKFLYNKVGKNAGQVISWLLVLFPIIFMVFVLILLFVYGKSLSNIDIEDKPDDSKVVINSDFYEIKPNNFHKFQDLL